jgi:hypothetical protein
MAARDWRNAADYAELAACDLSSLAWEFLRRSPAYQRAFQGAARQAAGAAAARWGLRALVSPDLPAAEAPVFWRPEAAPAHVLLLVRSAEGEVTAKDLIRRAHARLSTSEGEHLRLPGGLQVVLPPDAPLDAPLAAATPLGRELPVRITALAALERTLAGRQPAASLPPLSRRRLQAALRALDARRDGASYRELAEHLVSGVPSDPREWRTCNARDVAIRLCRTARRLADGGYLRLLRRRR